jgi:adenosylcobinamide kinase/adenosylcobinamide-phosphate guanylyltransferase
VSGRLLLVTGGARSGKSRYALGRAAASSGGVLFVATGVATDAEMTERIERHRAERPPGWATLEARYDLAAAISGALAGERTVLVEDLATLVSNLLVERATDEAGVRAEVEALLRVARESAADWIVVSNEVGLGLVPATPLGRRFRDLLGTANQLVAAAADEAVLMVSGLPLRLKG